MVYGRGAKREQGSNTSVFVVMVVFVLVFVCTNETSGNIKIGPMDGNWSSTSYQGM